MKTWMTPQTKVKNGYTKKLYINLLKLIVALLVLLSVMAILTFGILIHVVRYKEVLMFFTWIIMVALIGYAVWMAGHRLRSDAVIFCRDGDGCLYIMEAYNFVRHLRGIGRAIDIQNKLNEIKQQLEKDILPPEAIEILRTNAMKERSYYYSLVCQVRFHNGRTGKRSYILVKGYENEGELLYILEKMRTAENLLEIKENKNRIYVLISLLALAILVVLCICSHPYFGLLPQVIYFPCLGFAFITLLFTVYFIGRYRRGE